MKTKLSFQHFNRLELHFYLVDFQSGVKWRVPCWTGFCFVMPGNDEESLQIKSGSLFCLKTNLNVYIDY